MRTTIVQPDLAWENPAANREKLAKMVRTLAGKTDLIILPEMFTTGFSMNSTSLAESMEGETIHWMKDLASGLSAALTGSIIVSENNKFYNRLIFVYPGGDMLFYDKAHLFMMENENKHFEKGREQVIVDYLDFRINLQVCYDLRFPVWSRCVNNNYDMLIYVASWPAARRNVWSNLLVARAIENQCYVCGANRIGSDGEGINYTGDSVIIGPKGETVTSVDSETEGTATANLSRKTLDTFREKFPVWKDADRFTLDN